MKRSLVFVSEYSSFVMIFDYTFHTCASFNSKNTGTAPFHDRPDADNTAKRF